MSEHDITREQVERFVIGMSRSDSTEVLCIPGHAMKVRRGPSLRVAPDRSLSKRDVWKARKSHRRYQLRLAGIHYDRIQCELWKKITEPSPAEMEQNRRSFNDWRDTLAERLTRPVLTLAADEGKVQGFTVTDVGAKYSKGEKGYTHVTFDVGSKDSETVIFCSRCFNKTEKYGRCAECEARLSAPVQQNPQDHRAGASPAPMHPVVGQQS